MDYIWHYSSPLGGITLASDREALTGLWFDGQKYFASTLLSPWKEQTLPIFQEAVHWLDLYFGGAIPDFSPGFHLRGTPFQCAVWQSLLEIPYGHTATYGELARRTAARLQRNESARAVGKKLCGGHLAALSAHDAEMYCDILDYLSKIYESRGERAAIHALAGEARATGAATPAVKAVESREQER